MKLQQPADCRSEQKNRISIRHPTPRSLARRHLKFCWQFESFRVAPKMRAHLQIPPQRYPPIVENEHDESDNALLFRMAFSMDLRFSNSALLLQIFN
jgi:hypothetical protein